MPATDRTLIRGGTVIDGSGRAARDADVLIEGERVVDLIERDGPASAPRRLDAAIVDAAGLVVCPGFIDLHSHGDLVLALPPDRQAALMEGRLTQGITTEIVGNCGLGVFPCGPVSEPILRSIVSWMTPEPAIAWPWTDLGSYLAHLERNGVRVNAGALQAHGPLRIEAAGPDRAMSCDQPADVIERMGDRLEEALEQGAFGLSTGLIYPPGIATPTGEIVALATRLARRCGDTAFVASHIRGSSETLLDAVGELIEVGRRSGARLQHSHNEAVGRDHWHKIGKVLAMEAAARGSGVDLSFDMFPYTAAATMMIAIYPPWALAGGIDGLLRGLADPAARARIGEAIETTVPVWPPWTEGGWPHNLVRAVGWESITIGSVGTPANRHLEGMSLADLGRWTGRHPFEAISDLMLEERGAVSQIIHGISGDDAHDEGIETLLSEPAAVVCTDANDFGRGKPHPAAWGAYPRVLGRYVRERGLMTLPEAIHRMTGRPAAILGLPDRGTLRAGAFADLVILDPSRIGSEATWEAPRVRADGVVRVMVNGSVAVEEGRPAVGRHAAPAGKVLRRRG